MKVWWIVNVFWVIILIILGTTVMLRKYDAAGIYQTLQLKLATLAVLGVFLILIGLCQALAWYFIHRSMKKH